MRDSYPESSLSYIRSLYAQESDILASVRASAEQFNKAGIQVGAEEGRLLQWIIRQYRVHTIVEIGTFVGYSALWMASALPEDGYLYSCEFDPEHAATARTHFAHSPHAGQITLLEGDALESLKTLSAKAPFDMIFIDADKGGYPDYLDWAEQHIRPGGLIIGDNTLLFGSVYQDEPPRRVSKRSWNAMRAFNQRLADSSKFDTIMLPTAEGLTLAVKKG